MRLRIAEIDEHTVAHILGDKAAKAGDDVGDAAMVGADDLAQILGIEARRQRRRTDQIAEHHRQLPPLGLHPHPSLRRPRGRVRSGLPPPAKPEMALRRRLRCPSDTPSFSRSTSVSSGRISASMSLARKSASYCPRPRPLSQPPTSMVALPGHERIFLWLKRPVQGRAVEELGRARSGGPAIAGLGTVPSMVYPSSLALGEMANPRKTRIARFSRRMSSSSKRPICAPTLDFGTVVILSTISRVVANSPLRSFGLTGRRNKGASV